MRLTGCRGLHRLGRRRATRSASFCEITHDHFLMLTATPHKGDPENFSLFLQLLDQDAYADVKSIREAITRRVAPFYLRRTKEAMVYFPERQAGRQLGRTKAFHQARSSDRRFHHRWRRVRSLPRRYVLREISILSRRGEGR